MFLWNFNKGEVVRVDEGDFAGQSNKKLASLLGELTPEEAYIRLTAQVAGDRVNLDQKFCGVEALVIS